MKNVFLIFKANFRKISRKFEDTFSKFLMLKIQLLKWLRVKKWLYKCL